MSKSLILIFGLMVCAICSAADIGVSVSPVGTFGNEPFIPGTFGNETFIPGTFGKDIVIPDGTIGLIPPDAQLTDTEQLYADLLTYFKDRDNLLWHPLSPEQRENFRQWLKIYKSYKADPPAQVDLPENIRMIAQVDLPETTAEKKILQQNLEFYRQHGYNAALFRIDDFTRTDEIIAAIRYIKSLGFAVWGYFSPGKYIHGISLPHPVKLAAALRRIAPELTGWILGRGRTSVHLFTQDPPYMQYICKTLRAGNPSIVLLGELYYGYNYVRRNDKTLYWTFNNCSGTSGIVLHNRGFLGADPRTVIRKAGDNPVIAVVAGPRKEYLRSSITFERQFEIKRRIEKAYLAAGAKGTITEHTDGNEQSIRKDGSRINNNLSKTLYSEVYSH